MADDFYYLQPEKLALNYRHFSDFFLNPPGHHYNPLDVILNFHLFKTTQTPAYLYSVNLLLFFINAVLLFILIKRLTKSQIVGATSAILFIVHPVNAENLSHITFNTVFCSAIFLQLSMIIFWDTLSSVKTPRTWFYLSLIFFLIGLLFLETALLFPVYLCFLCLPRPAQERMRALSLTLPFWAISISYFALWFLMTRGGTGFSNKIEHLHFSLNGYLATSSLLLKWYWGNLFFPDDLVFIKSSAVLSNNLTLWITGLTLFAFSMALLIWFLRKTPKSIALLWFLTGFAFMFPSSIIHAYSMGMVIEPHWFYFSSMGFFMLLALFFHDISQKVKPIFARGLFSAIILFWAITSYRHHVIAQSEVSYLEYWLTISPGNNMPSLRLGHLYGLESKLKIPVKIIPEMEKQADFFITTKQFSEASRLIEKMLSSQPSDLDRVIWEGSLTAVYLRMGDSLKAAEQLTKLSSLRLSKAQYSQIAIQLDHVELREQAVLILDQGFKDSPDDPDLIYLKAVILANLNHFEEAEAILSSKTGDFPQKPQFSELLKNIEDLKVAYTPKPPK